MRDARVHHTAWKLLPARCVVGLGLLLFPACDGHIGDTGGLAGVAGPSGGNPSAPGAPARDPGMAGYAPGSPGLTDRPAPTTRFARLSHTQWGNTVRDLFSLDTAGTIADGFRLDPAVQGFLFDDNVLSLSVDETLWGAYQRAAADIAAQVTGDTKRLAALLPPAGGNAEARAKTFITDFGLKAYRRPLEAAEVDDYLALYRGAAGAYAGVADDVAGIRLFLEAVLQSPHFLYRVETSATRTGDVVPLTNYEVASRLSYMLWNTMPDAELLRAAKANELDQATKVAAQAARLLDDPRASDVMASFHAQLMNVAHYETISPAAAFFPKAPAKLGALAAAETDAFVRKVGSGGGGFAELLTGKSTFVNKDLAGLYGLTGSFSDAFVEAPLDPSQRSGLLTQVGFLASNATTTTPDPIHRGVFVARRILCEHISAPPDNATPLPPPSGRTNRETVEAHTQQPGSICINCHGSTINPLGFPFENYDATGAYRTTDTNKPVDAATDPMIDGEQIHVKNAVELAFAISKSEDAHACYASHWLEFAYGRPSVDVDDPLVNRLGQASAAGTLSVKAMILGLVKTEAFLTRNAEELP